MPDQVLEITLQGLTANELAINVKNVSQTVLAKKVSIGITLPEYLLDARISEAAQKAASSTDPRGAASMTEIAKGPSGWSMWVMMGDTSGSIVDILLYNHRNSAGKKLTPPIKLETGEEFIIRIPLNANPVPTSLAIPYSYQHGDRTDDPSVKGELNWKAPDTGEWKPDVKFETDSKSPTMIIPGKEVEISWHIGDAVGATLRGPLPGGNSEWALTDTPSPFNMSDGSFKIAVVGPMTYVLQAQVERKGKPNVEVVKMLFLDVDRGKYGFVSPRPSRVLPYGLVEVDWSAWGVKSTTLTTAGASRKIPLTDMTLTGYPKGTGVMRITAGKAEREADVSVKLLVELGQTQRKESEDDYTIVPWVKMGKPHFRGTPVGLAVAAPKMALLTTETLWIATVGREDSFNPDQQLQFTMVAAEMPKMWLAIAALGERFVVLRQTHQDDLQVALYDSDGKRSAIPPLDLPGLRPLMTSGAVFDLAAYGDRAYVVVESSSLGVRSAFSVGFNNNQAEYRHELLLEGFLNYRLLTFADGLYALNRDSGEMFRLELENGQLEPYRAASAVDERGASRVKRGFLIPVGNVLAVSSPSSVPSLTALAPFGLKNVLPYENLISPADTSTIPQDLVYSPQHDRWSRCGHGLDIEGVVAFRGGDSPRLWMIDSTGDAYTLTVLSEHLFVHNYVTDLPPTPLPEVFNKKRELAFVNHTGIEFVPMNETCLKAGLKPFSATGRVHLTSPLPTGPTNPRRAEPVDLRYNEAETPAATLRFLAKRGIGVKHEYVLEVTVTGPRFSQGKAVFKRIAVDDRGNVTSVVVVPDKDDFPPTSGLIETFPKQLSNGIRLRIRNRTPYTLWLRSPDATTPAEQLKIYDPEEGIRIKYNTPPFSIYAHGMGEFPVDVDFALPPGIEVSPGSEVQKRRIRIRQNGPVALETESVSVKEARDYDDYECALIYQVHERLRGSYLGDGVPGKDGASIYVPLAEAPNVTSAKILKIDANNLQTMAQASVTARNIFLGPNSVAVLEDRILALFNREQMNIFYHDLQSKSALPLAQFDYNILTSLKGSGPYIFTVGMKETTTGGGKYHYRGDTWFFDNERLHHYTTGWLVSPRTSGGPSRVPEAPSWVAPNTISPMDAREGAALAICVDGGVIGSDVKNGFKQIDVALPGTGREEAVHVDPTEHVIFCAHSKPSGSGLMVSRINLANPSDKLTVELPGTIMHIVTDSQPFVGPNLEYYRPRAVSLLATPDVLFVSHARKIYVLDKTKLTQRQSIQLRLPLRLIQARREKAPGDNHPTYGPAPDCYFVWAIGARYIGDGQAVSADEYGKTYDTALFKIALAVTP